MKYPIITTIASVALLLGACGGGGSSSSDDSTQSVDEIPLDITIDDVELTAGVPRTLEFAIPKPEEPYTEFTIDLGRTLQEANISVTPM